MAHVQTSPLFAALHPVLARVKWPSQAWPPLADYQAFLDQLPQPVMTASGARLRVAPQASEKSNDWRQGYEPRIYLTGELSTRAECWHDVLNLMVWSAFPQSKAALNARHFALLEARMGLPSRTTPRQPAQDALTQFDESGVIIVSADETLSELLHNFRWKNLFWDRRADVQAHMRCFLFGHGLMEKALMPYRGMTGKGIVLPVETAFFTQAPARQIADIDEQLARLIADPQKLMKPHDLAPVPVLGFPGFTPANEKAAYYEDQNYFRPGRGAAP
ncbi:MAG: DUF3025 domain-containing protein [Burkholderiales bacterium]|nr:DUF3025 domain-containing protein [Burkholderiales bacterium]